MAHSHTHQLHYWDKLGDSTVNSVCKQNNLRSFSERSPLMRFSQYRLHIEGRKRSKQLKFQERTLELRGLLAVLHSLAQTSWKLSLFGTGSTFFFLFENFDGRQKCEKSSEKLVVRCIVSSSFLFVVVIILPSTSPPSPFLLLLGSFWLIEIFYIDHICMKP